MPYCNKLLNEYRINMSICPSALFVSKTTQRILIKFSTGGSRLNVLCLVLIQCTITYMRRKVGENG
jgi:hypothetical protein